MNEIPLFLLIPRLSDELVHGYLIFTCDVKRLLKLKRGILILKYDLIISSYSVNSSFIALMLSIENIRPCPAISGSTAVDAVSTFLTRILKVS